MIGGAALNLMGIMNRATKDCDILYPEIPETVGQASRAFALEVRQTGEILQDDWLNNGPASLTEHLQPGWRERFEPLFTGKAIHFQRLGRIDFLCAKLFALCDRGIDFADCVALAPSVQELQKVLPWLQEQDAHPQWPEHVRATLAELGRRLGYGL